MSNIDISQLSAPTPESEIKHREQAGITLSYIDARFCMDRLDAVCGLGGWSCDYKEVKGLLMCGVSVIVDGLWVTKWDVGSEANFEKDKSIVSDSFKRACVKWGIGRDLYRIKKAGVKGNATPLPSELSLSSPGKPQPNTEEYVFTFGKHIGKKVSNVPVDYLQWFLNQGDKKDPALVQTLTNEYNKRMKEASV